MRSISIMLAISILAASGAASAAGEDRSGASPPFLPRLTDAVAIPTLREARDGLPSTLAPIQKRAGQNIRRDALLARRILLAFIEENNALPADGAVDAEVARVRARPLMEVFGCCASGTLDDHLAQNYMTPDDFRESSRVDLGLRRIADIECAARVSASPATRRARLAALDGFYARNTRKVWILLFLPPDDATGQAAPESALQRRARDTAKRLADGAPWEAVVREADNVAQGLPPDGSLGLVPDWRPLVEGDAADWKNLPADTVSKPLKAVGGGWVILKWQPVDDDDLLEMAREEDTLNWIGTWLRTAMAEAQKVVPTS